MFAFGALRQRTSKEREKIVFLCQAIHISSNCSGD
jgi:hypothetical protein